MRILNCKSDLTLTDIDDNKTTLLKNNDYIVPDIIIEMLKANRVYDKQVLRDEDFYESAEHKRYRGEDLSDKKIITFRNGGIGDLMFQLPALKEIKKKYPTSNVTLCCNQKFKELFDGMDYIDEVLNVPMLLNDVMDRDYFVNFEGLIENNPDAEEKNAYDLHNEQFFIEPEEKCPELIVDKNEEQIIKPMLRGEIRIIIAFAASVPIRSVDPQLWKNLIDSVNDERVRWYIVSTPFQNTMVEEFIKQVKNKNKIINWSKLYPRSFKKLIALVNNCDCVIAPDSGLLHMAGGLKKKLIGIYGPFPSELRLKYYKNAIGLDAIEDDPIKKCFFARGKYCSCFQHGNGSCSMANKTMERYSPCMKHDFRHILFALEKLGIKLKLLEKKNEKV